MIGKQFYPTPKEVIEIMLEPYKRTNLDQQDYNYLYYNSQYKLNDKTILEPSAGKGDIVKFIIDNSGRGSTDNIHVIEIDPDLQNTLKGAGYKLIGTDFLQYSGDTYFDLIIMNPPFENGVKHLLHAWKILKAGDIVCLLNNESLANPFNKERLELTHIIKKHGSTELLGNCFKEAQRTTDVNVVLVRLHKEEEESKFNFRFKQKTKEGIPDLDEESVKNQVIIHDIIGNILIQHESLKDMFIEFLKAKKGLEFYANGLLHEHSDVFEMAIGCSKNDPKMAFNTFSERSRASAWKRILYESKVQKYMTSRVSKEFDSFVKEQGLMDLTRENIFAVIEHIFQNRNNIMEQAILDAFELMTKHHVDNRFFVEGWKTNDKWKVNRKIIMEWDISFGNYDTVEHYRNYGSSFNISYHGDVSNKYHDIEMALCYLSGKDIDNINSIYWTLKNKFDLIGSIKPNEKFDNSCQSTFFDIKFYKKGSLHLTFRDKSLWEKFNYEACKALKWLPPEETDPWKKKQNKHKAQSEYNYSDDNKPVVSYEQITFQFD